MIGSTNLSGGGGVGSDELTATAANVLEETTYVGADTDDELAEGTMQHLSNRATITHTTENATKVIEGDAAFTSINSDGTARAEIRYNGTEGFITPNTLFAVPQGDMATAGGLTAGKLLQGQSAFGIAGTATSDATAAANQISSGKIAYVKGSKVTGTLVERGQSQYGGFGSGSGYIAINSLPEGIYRSNGADWAPESRIATSTLASGIGLSANKIKKGVSILGITGTFEGSASNPLWLKNSSGTASNGWLSYVLLTNHWGNGTYDYGTLMDNQYIEGSVSSSQNIHILGRLSNPIILTPYNTLHILISTSYTNHTLNLYRIGAGSTSMSGNSFNAYVDCAGSVSNAWYTINISSLSGQYCIYAFLEHNGGGGSRYSASGRITIIQAYLD
ncbi:hypothetical protein [uncultured Clostridium sp.]|uniref:hypothetical protein n=1 Tax=uncultured Clostridium sp. TaxID=59620 RepID=UPI0025CFBC47|nr:hypothetical protein [uncultured Clostridium sp.]